ncbi:MAG: M24 family metallopeptidase [Oscillochloris sp.]|nr:M24 family metallopeptidase [Oscillochloris sp.]
MPLTTLPLRAQAELRNAWLRERLDLVVPVVLERAGLDMWLVIACEYNEDPVIMSLLPEPAMSARRRTILCFARRPDGGVDRFTLDRYGHGEFYQRAWNPDAESQDACLTRLITERDPARIGVNVSETFAFGDGLSHSEYQRLVAAIGPEYATRLVSAEAAAVGWLEMRIPAEIDLYPQIIAMGHALIARTFSREVIVPGITTTTDVVWWMRQTMHDAGLRAWFQPTVEIQSLGQRYDAEQPRSLILPGDLLHCDVGFTYLGLCTDQQQHAYVLREGETNAPVGLRVALAEGNRLQDILIGAMQVGCSGNAVLSTALEQARAVGMTPSIYSHPLGYHGHAAGPTIGLWDQQDGVPGNGDYPLYDWTAYSIELNVRCVGPEWDGQEVRIALEEDALLCGGTVSWLHGRQGELHLI